MKIGTKWYGSNGDIFEIDDVRVLNSETWVFYTNTFTMKSFSCLIEAFIGKFIPVNN
jgi:hypothetical protein